MGSQPRRGEPHWAPSSASRLLIDFTVAPSAQKVDGKVYKGDEREWFFDRHIASAYLIVLRD
jgi:hypothetical protein